MKAISRTIVLLMALLAMAAAVSAQTCCALSATCGVADPPADNALTAQEQAAGWQLLFDGKTAKGWACTEENSKGWVLQNGAIYYNKEGGGYFYTKDRFGDFELKIDFMVDKGTNSGIFFRWDNLGNAVQTGIEMQLLDSAAATKMGKHDCGAIYDVLAPSENAMKPALEWNTLLMTCRGPYVFITMNDKRVIRLNLDRYTEPHKNLDGTGNKFDTAYKLMPRQGHIGLQAHGGKVWFKNVKIRQLK